MHLNVTVCIPSSGWISNSGNGSLSDCRYLLICCSIANLTSENLVLCWSSSIIHSHKTSIPWSASIIPVVLTQWLKTSICKELVILLYTVFIRIVATATINFSLAWVRLLIQGSSYSRVAFINLGPIRDSVIHQNRSRVDWFTKTALRIIEIRSSKKLPRCSRIKPGLSSAIV